MIIDKRKSDYWHETPLCPMCTVNTPSFSGELLATDRLRNDTACTALHTEHEVSVGGPGYSVNTESARLLLLISKTTTNPPSPC
jgi:hypothetical protein